jgi:hypothetical protein
MFPTLLDILPVLAVKLRLPTVRPFLTLKFAVAIVPLSLKAY